MITQIDPGIIQYNKKIQEWCKLPYPKHPNGCPNYGSERSLRGIRKDLQERVIRECPPVDRLIDDIFDFTQNVAIIYKTYPVGLDAEKRRISNPKLKTPGDWYNFRYWQDRARKELYAEVANYLDRDESTIVDLCPEAHGVNLVKLMRQVCVKLDFGKWPPEHNLDNIEYQIAMGGYAPKKKN